MDDVLRHITEIERRVRNLESQERPQVIFEPFLRLPGLVGLWLPSSVQRSTGQIYDVSGQARHLTRNGNPIFNVYNNWLPYADFSGAGDYFSRASETDLSVTGLESIFAGTLNGLTVGGIFWSDTVAASFAGLVGKANNATQNSYLLYRYASSFNFAVSSSGSGFAATAVGSVAANQFYTVVGRFTPGDEVALFINRAKSVVTTGVPASLFTSTTALQIGTYATNYLNGRCALAFLCATAVPDEAILGLPVVG